MSGLTSSAFAEVETDAAVDLDRTGAGRGTKRTSAIGVHTKLLDGLDGCARANASASGVETSETEGFLEPSLVRLRDVGVDGSETGTEARDDDAGWL